MNIKNDTEEHIQKQLLCKENIDESSDNIYQSLQQHHLCLQLNIVHHNNYLVVNKKNIIFAIPDIKYPLFLKSICSILIDLYLII
jgi:hypothetical protein